MELATPQAAELATPAATWGEIVPGSNMATATGAAQADVVAQDFAHLTANPTPEPGRLAVAKKSTVRNIAKQMSNQELSEPSRKMASTAVPPKSSQMLRAVASSLYEKERQPQTASSPAPIRPGPLRSMALSLYEKAGAPAMSHLTAARPSSVGGGSGKFPTVQPAGGIVNGVVFAASSANVARPIAAPSENAHASPTVVVGGSYESYDPSLVPRFQPADVASGSSAAAAASCQASKATRASASSASSANPTAVAGQTLVRNQEHNSPVATGWMTAMRAPGGSGSQLQKKMTTRSPKARPSSPELHAAQGSASPDSIEQSLDDTDASMEIPAMATAAPVSPRAAMASTAVSDDERWLRQMVAKRDVPWDSCLRGPKDLWNMLDNVIFAKLWHDRPWAPIPGGASHLQYKPKAPPYTRPKPPPTWEGTRWSVRGLRWKRLDEIELETSHSLPEPTLAHDQASEASALAMSSTPGSAMHATPGKPAGGGGRKHNRPGGTQFEVTGALREMFTDPGASCALKVRIQDERFTLTQSLEGNGIDLVHNFERMREAFLNEGEACYVLFRGGEDVWALFSFVSDDAPVREKMMYSWGRATLVSALGGSERIPWHDHWNSLAEVELPSEDAPGDPDGGEDAHIDAMTEVERQLLEGERQARAEQASYRRKGSRPAASSGLQFPLTKDAKAALDAFRTRALGAVVVAIDGEQIVLRSTASALTPPAALREHVPREPCYILYRWAHEHQDAAATAVLFLYMRPEEAAMRSKMLHASSRMTFLASLEGYGITVTKSLEGLEEHELTEECLIKELYVYNVDGADVEAQEPVAFAGPEKRSKTRDKLRSRGQGAQGALQA